MRDLLNIVNLKERFSPILEFKSWIPNKLHVEYLNNVLFCFSCMALPVILFTSFL